MKKYLLECEAKLTREDQLLNELYLALKDYSDRNTEVITRRVNYRRSEIEYRVVKFEEVPLSISVRIAEILHNLRSPLEYLIQRLANGVKTSKQNAFLIEKDKGAYDLKAPKWLARVPEVQRKRIFEMQPFNAPVTGIHPLYVLKELNDADKHRLLPIHRVHLLSGQFHAPDAEIVKGGSGAVLTTGSHIVTLRFPKGIDLDKIQIPFEIKVDLQFDAACGFGNLLVQNTLTGIRAFIHQEVFVDPMIEGFEWNFTHPKHEVKSWRTYMEQAVSPTTP